MSSLHYNIIICITLSPTSVLNDKGSKLCAADGWRDEGWEHVTNTLSLKVWLSLNCSFHTESDHCYFSESTLQPCHRGPLRTKTYSCSSMALIYFILQELLYSYEGGTNASDITLRPRILFSLLYMVSKFLTNKHSRSFYGDNV